jgi:NadR type nicotinamide-nucleotide adenylyltransferase
MYKITLTGPESVGKSTLARQLAEHFNGIFVSEFARAYVENLQRNYTYNDVVIIAEKQIEQYNSYCNSSNQAGFVFFDTFLIITKVWFNVVYNRCPAWLGKAIEQHPMDLYLLCYPDLPWEADGVRENETNRLQLFEMYQHELDFYGFNYHIIKGNGHERLQAAINEINKLIIWEQPNILKK